jgi:uncharacterized protein
VTAKRKKASKKTLFLFFLFISLIKERFENKMYINIIESYRIVIAICDSEILGKRFEEGKKQLHVKESFYKGEKGKEIKEEELVKIIEINKTEDATFNIVGKKSVNIALKTKLIHENSVLEIDGIPYSLVLI